ncbi:uncharacterized protein LOC121763310 isoform X1 [Salvia splendens]|uniref:uncharacterized protein LOC121763310 isoform X1 n=1 Tax=Salvia splendens TaxID=180675 RepID=UPI001C26199C|nr:uncharacterized protein LOC121763310 isoform X1 [Salvia splendens]
MSFSKPHSTPSNYLQHINFQIFDEILILASSQDVGIRRKSLLGKKGEGGSERNSCGICMDVKSGEAFAELYRSLLFSRVEFHCLPSSIPQFLQFCLFLGWIGVLASILICWLIEFLNLFFPDKAASLAREIVIELIQVQELKIRPMAWRLR